MKKLILLFTLAALAGCATRGPDYYDMARESGGSAIAYPLKPSPATDDQVLGISSPSGIWSIQRFSISTILDLLDGVYEPADATIIKEADVLNEPDMISDSQTKPPSQAATIDYVQTKINENTITLNDGGVESLQGTAGTPANTPELKTVDGTTIEIVSDVIRVKDGGISFGKLAPDAKFRSLAVADLNDTSSPHVLTTAETTNTVISNYAASGADRVFSLPPAHAAGNIIFQIGDEFEVDVDPPSGTAFYLNGTAASSDENLVNAADTLGDRMVCYCVNINGTLRWMCYSDSFVEASP